ncbi:MAG: hypothetical protein IPG58_19595 [Acidobacteria bacterium]|nr:hypothetical protein [Acidobacteriota bacterium]
MNSKAFDQESIKKILAADNEISDEVNVRTATAPFQAEFPYERDSEAQVTRREFCNFLFLTSSALFLKQLDLQGNLHMMLDRQGPLPRRRSTVLLASNPDQP